MQNKLAHLKYRDDIDGLRAIAVLAVVAFHAFPDWAQGGFIGVDIFFVTSGFLISTIIFKSLDQECFSFSEFYRLWGREMLDYRPEVQPSLASLLLKHCTQRTQNFLSKLSERCYLKVSRHLELTKKYRSLLNEVQSSSPKKIKIFDTLNNLCDVKNGECFLYKDGRSLYSYSDHISDYAAGLIGQDLNTFVLNE